MAEACNYSRTLSWLINPCIPKSPSQLQTQNPPVSFQPEPEPPISSLPDDLLLACLARVPLSSLPSSAATCRRFLLLLSSRHFFPLRRSLPSPLLPTLFALSISSADLIAAVRPLDAPDHATWQISSFPLPFPLHSPCFVSIDNVVYVIGSKSAFKFDTWTARIAPISPPSIPRKKFATAAVHGRIFVSGGSSRTSAVEIYDPEADTWRIGAEGPTRRYGCVGAAAGDGESFYVSGGLTSGGDARSAGTADVYNVRSGQWAPRATRAVPGGGCVVGACGVGTSLYVVASNAVEISLWRWDPPQDGGGRRRGGAHWGGEWVPLEAPPLIGGGGIGPLRFGCCGVREGRMAVAAQVTGRGQNGDFQGGGVCVYDVGRGEWSRRGPELPVGFRRRAALVCVEC